MVLSMMTAVAASSVLAAHVWTCVDALSSAVFKQQLKMFVGTNFRCCVPVTADHVLVQCHPLRPNDSGTCVATASLAVSD